jgi:UDP-glucose 4-epimerase
MDAKSIIASLNVIKNCHRAGVKKIIFTSSGFLYGNKAKRPANESQPIDPISPYVVSKHAVENYLWYYRKNFSLPFVIFRYATIYGPRQTMGAMADYIRQLKAGRQAKIWGDGTKTRDYVFVEDVVKANLLALTVPADFESPLFNIGTGKETTLNEVYGKIAKIFNKEARPIYLPDRLGEQLQYSLDSEKVFKELGWRPKINLEEGLRKTIFL